MPNSSASWTATVRSTRVSCRASATLSPPATLDLCLGARRPVNRSAWPAHARLGNRLIAFELRRRAGVWVTDIGPMRCAGREDLLALALRDRAFGWPLEMVLSAAAAGWTVSEVGVSYRPRAGGHSKVSGSLTGTWRATRDMSRLLRSVANSAAVSSSHRTRYPCSVSPLALWNVCAPNPRIVGNSTSSTSPLTSAGTRI